MSNLSMRLDRLEAADPPPGPEPRPRLYLPWKEGREPLPPPVAEQIAAGHQIIIYHPDDPDAPPGAG